MRKIDITTRNGKPACNVKVYTDPWANYKPTDGSGPDPRFRAWADAIPNAVQQDFWELACEDAWTAAETEAREIFGDSVNVWQEGRSGGWLVVQGLPPVESWDAIMVSKWATFARRVELIREGVTWDFRNLLYYNVFTPEMADLAPIVPPAV